MVQSTSRRGILNPEAARRHFRLSRIPPPRDLAHLVERHWIVEWDLSEPFTQEIVTHPSVNMVFEPGGPNDPRRLHRPLAHELDGHGHVIATKFRPGGFHPFHPVPAHTLTNRVDPARDVFAAFAPTTIEVASRTACARTSRRTTRASARSSRCTPRCSPTPRSRASSTCAPLAGYSQRTLQRLFREYVGVTPKWVLERIRLHEAAERMADGEGDWAAWRSTSATSTRRTSSRRSRPSSAARPPTTRCYRLAPRRRRVGRVRACRGP